MTPGRNAFPLNGLFVSGLLLALIGAVLPAWNYHLTEQHTRSGLLFAALALGVIGSAELNVRLLRRFTSSQVRILACAAAAVTLFVFGWVGSAVRFEVQCPGSLVLGGAAGLLNFSAFESGDGATFHPSATFLVRAGLHFGAGCLCSAALVALAFWLGNAFQAFFVLSGVAAAFAVLQFTRTPILPQADSEVSFSQALQGFSKPGALAFGLLLLLQSGSEWTVAGWLSLFLTHRLGTSPETALWMLSLYWLFLLAGRVAATYVLPVVRHGRILWSSVAAALLGCGLLVSTDNSFGAATSIILIGLGFSSIYPLLGEKVGARFPSGSPAVFSLIFSTALAGGMLFPFAAGLIAGEFGLSAIMVIPAIGTSGVAALLLVLWLESKVTGR